MRIYENIIYKSHTFIYNVIKIVYNRLHQCIDQLCSFFNALFTNEPRARTAQVLDEPTNHLDLQTVEALGEALKAPVQKAMPSLV